MKASDRQYLETTYTKSRGNLLLIIIFTAINIVFAVTGSDTYFLFSAYIPYALTIFGMMFCGMLPAEFYGGDLTDIQFLDKSVFAIFLIIALIFTVLYLISWIFSKKNRVGWLIFSLIFFIVDTVTMFAISGFAMENIIDIVFHIWVIVSLSIGINAGLKAKKLPEKADDIVTLKIDETNENSMALRYADLNVKSRILLSGEALGRFIIYRRVKNVNELVINSNVYDEITAIVELAHTLKARIDGHLIEVVYDGRFNYLKVDGEIIAKKVRLF